MTDRTPIQDLLDRIDQNWPEAASVETDIVFAIVRLHELIKAHADQALVEHSLSHAAFEILVALRAQPEPRQVTPTELYRSALLSSGGTTKLLIQLEERGLVERAPNPDDGRSKLVKLTTSGKTIVEAAMKDVMRHDKALFSMVNEAREMTNLRATLLLALKRLVP
jgi:DNA-binding MarR family transcriptional regulator